MRSILLIFFAALSFSSIAQNDQKTQEAVVLELFTSEGCSSCPPFEKLAEILSEKYGDQLIVLSQHVDYWDYLGWTDRLASPEYTARQAQYKAQFNARYLVTPQFVGNGTEIVKGNYVQSWIDKQLEHRSPSKINFEASVCQSKLCIDYQLPSSELNKELYIALIENNIYSDVKAGENRGKQYNHQNIVRYLKRVPLTDVEGNYSYELPGDLELKNCEVAVFVQDTESLEISSAQRKKLL